MAKSKNGVVICSGNLVYDTLVRPVHELHWGGTTFVDTIEFHAGGNGASTARALGILGRPVRLLGAVGNDPQGEFLLERVGSAGVDVSRVERTTAPTSATVGIVRENGERKFFHRAGASAEAFASGITFTPELLKDAVHYHMASLLVLPRLRPDGAAVLQQAKAAGLSTSLDTNWDPQGTWMRDLEPCLPYLDYLFMNEPEAEQITGSTNPATACQVVLEMGVGAAILKRSERGCAIYSRREQHLCPAFQVEARDTTGAGDCFAAGFLDAVLAGATLREAGDFANAVGALSVQAMGAVNGILSRGQTLAWMKTAHRREN